MKKLLLIIGFVVILATSGSAFWFSTPELIYPEDQARFGFDSSVPVFEWEEIDASSYEIEFAIDNDFEVTTGPLISTQPFFDLQTIIPVDIWKELSITLIWRVRAIYPMNIKSPWADPRIFYKTRLKKPELISPLNDARFSFENEMPWFRWFGMDEADHYLFQFSVNENFEEVLAEIHLENTELDLRGGERNSWDELVGIFYWRVSAVDTCDHPGPWSTHSYFSKTQIGSPRIIWPGDGTRFPHCLLHLLWNGKISKFHPIIRSVSLVTVPVKMCWLFSILTMWDMILVRSWI